MPNVCRARRFLWLVLATIAAGGAAQPSSAEPPSHEIAGAASQPSNLSSEAGRAAAATQADPDESARRAAARADAARADAVEAAATLRSLARVDSSNAWLLHLPGIAGESRIDYTLLQGFKEGGFAGKIRVFDWTGEFKGLSALMNRKRNDEQATLIADLVADHRKQHPKQPIVLTSHSGGTGLAVFALEKLPEGVTVDGLLLLSPALSPDYDLSLALRHVTGKAYVFSSPLDVLVLGVGTKLFGTIDRKQGESAGRSGFVVPKDAAHPEQYQKLIPCPYQQSWMRFGNVGDHITLMSSSFSRNVLLPIVLSQLPGAVPGPLTRPVNPPPPPGDR